MNVDPAAVHGCRPASGENLPDKAKSAGGAQCFLSMGAPERPRLNLPRISTRKSFALVPETRGIFKFEIVRLPTDLLPFIFPFGDPFQHSKPSLLRVRNRERLELQGRTEIRNQFPNRLFTRRTIRQRLGVQRPTQSEFAPTHLAVTLAQLVLVNRHIPIFAASSSLSN